jgi:hypothetical protein
MDFQAALSDLEADDKDRQDRGFSSLVAAGRGIAGALPDALSRPLAHKSFHRIGLLLAAMQVKASIPALLDLLDRGTLGAHDRSLATRVLGELADGVSSSHAARFEAALLSLSRDDAPLTRRYAVDALQKINSAIGNERLLQMSQQDPDASVRQRAKDAAPAVVDFTLPTAATTTTKSAATSNQVPEGAEAVDFASMIAELPAQPAHADVPPLQRLVDMLATPRWADRQKVVDAVVQAAQANPAMGALVVEKLLHGTAAAKLGACLVCARLQLPDGVNPLMVLATSTATNDDERELPSIALKALANCLTGQELGLAGTLLPLCKHRDPFMRAGALLCLGRLPDRVAVKAAVLGLADEHEHVQKSAAIALSEAVREEDTALVPALVALWRRTAPLSAEAHEAILIALTRIAIDAPPWVVRVRHHARKHVFGQTASMRRGAITLLERLFSDVDPPPVSVVDDIANRLQDPHPDVRLVAASFLARHQLPGMPGMAERLRKSIDERVDRELPMASILLDALARLGTTAAINALKDLAAQTPLLAARAQQLLDENHATVVVWVDSSSVPPTVTPPPQRRPRSDDVVNAKDDVNNDVPRVSTPFVEAEVDVDPAAWAAASCMKQLDVSLVWQQMVRAMASTNTKSPEHIQAWLREAKLDEAGVKRIVGVTQPGLSSSSAAAFAVVRAAQSEASALVAAPASAGFGLLQTAYEAQLRARKQWLEQQTDLRSHLSAVDSQEQSPSARMHARARLLSP